MRSNPFRKSKSTIRLENGRKRIVHSRCKRAEWTVLIRDHHEGYIDWNVYESNQALIANNENAKSRSVRGSVKRGGALLTGLLRCGHCGARIVVQYPTPAVIRYQCSGNALKHEGSCCVMFGGQRADRLVSEQVLHCLTPLAIQAAIEAIDSLQSSSDERIRHKQLALEQARYEVAHARRQYDAVDPANRLVACELERRWNEALSMQAQIENELTVLQSERPHSLKDSTKRELLALAQDVPDLWNHPQSSPEHKKHILRAVLKEIMATSQGDSIQLLLHWHGGEHTQLQLPKTRTGHHRYVIAADTIDLVRALARVQPDAMIASILNRAGLRTAHGKSWTAKHVCSLRYNHSIMLYKDEDRKSRGELFVCEVAISLDLTPSVLMRLIRRKQLPATQVCTNAPWIVRKDDLEKFSVQHRRDTTPKPADENQLTIKIQ
jgi:hypothetical protein